MDNTRKIAAKLGFRLASMPWDGYLPHKVLRRTLTKAGRRTVIRGKRAGFN